MFERVWLSFYHAMNNKSFFDLTIYALLSGNADYLIGICKSVQAMHSDKSVMIFLNLFFSSLI